MTELFHQVYNPVAGNVLLSALVASLLSASRLGRLVESEKYDPVSAYSLAEYMGDLRRSVFSGATPDLNRRQLQRGYLQRLEALITPPLPTAAPPGFGGGAPARPIPFVTPPALAQSDLPAFARMQLREIQRDARTSASATANVTARAHWSDIVERAAGILEPKR